MTKEEIKAKNKEYYEANKDKIKEYREANKDKIKEYDEDVRTCKECNEILPIDNFPVATAQGHRRKICKECHYLQKSKDPVAYIKRKKYVEELHILQTCGERRCSMCDIIKLLDEFSNDSSKPSRVFYNRKSYCKKCAHEVWRVPASKTERYKKLKAISNRKNKQSRLLVDPLFKLRGNISCNIRNSMKTKKFRKKSRTVDILGCSFDDFKVHIEQQFPRDMNWDNSGLWQYDHIIPISSATSEEELLRLNHYTNFQPLWEEDNRIKSNKPDWVKCPIKYAK